MKPIPVDKEYLLNNRIKWLESDRQELRDWLAKEIKTRESMDNILTLFTPAQRAFNAGIVQAYKEIINKLGTTND